MPQPSYGQVFVVNLPGIGSLLSRSWELYKALFKKLLTLALLFTVGLIVNFSLGLFFDYVSAGKTELVQAILQILGALVNIAAFLYYCYIMAGMVYLVHNARQGITLTVSQSLTLAQERYRSLFWVLVLFGAVTYGSLATFILAALFYIWFYFCIYTVLLDEERGLASLAKSRYLTHGIFFKSLGRYVAISVIGISLLYFSYLFLAVHLIGGYLFLLLALAIGFFGFPFYLVYDYLRYEDVLRIERSTPFTFFRGERAALAAWAIFGFILFASGWTYGILGKSGRAWVTDHALRPVAQMILPLSLEVRRNIDSISPILEKIDFLTTTPTVKK